MFSNKNLDRRYYETNTGTSRYLKVKETALVITKLATEYLCYNITANRIIGVDDKKIFFVLDTDTNKLNHFGEPINDLEDLGNGFIQLSYFVDCCVIDAIDLLYMEFSCIDVVKSKDPTTFVIETDTTIAVVDRQTRRIKLKTAKI